MVRVRIGSVVRAVGLEGDLGVAGWDGSLPEIPMVELRRPGEGEGPLRKVLRARLQGRIRAVRVEGIADRTAAEQWLGSEVLARREDLGEAGEGRHWWADLEGLPVFTATGEALGKVTGLLATGAVDVLVVRQEEIERLIPLAPYVAVDLEAGRITVDPPEGLLDLEET